MYKDVHLYRERSAELLRVYREVAPLCITERQAAERVVKHKSPRFWVTPHAVYDKLWNTFTGRSQELPLVKANEIRMYTELLSRLRRLSCQPENMGMSFTQLCEKVVREEAPEFYMSPSTFRQLLASERKRLREERRRRHVDRR